MLAALAVLAGLLPGTASADPQRGLLVVEGQGNRSAVFEITEASRPREPFPALTGGDRYAAVLVERLDGDPRTPVVVSAAQVRAFRDDTSAAQGRNASGQLAPGRYRVTLLGDAPMRAEWELVDPEAPGILVAPRSPVAARFLGRAEPLDGDLSQSRVDMPNALPAGRRVLQVLLLSGTRADDVRMCATTAQDCSRPLEPVCLPAPAPSCSLAESPALPTSHSAGEVSASLSYSAASSEVRALRWSVEGYREEPDRLRAAAIVF